MPSQLHQQYQVKNDEARSDPAGKLRFEITLKEGHLYAIVIPCPRGLYGIYCLSPRAKAINPMRPEGAYGITISKPTIAMHLL